MAKEKLFFLLKMRKIVMRYGYGGKMTGRIPAWGLSLNMMVIIQCRE